jgi:hypothetical protein
MTGAEQAFDLNIEKVLEHWSVPFAIRELIANALDEQVLTGAADPQIYSGGAGCWYIRDAGRGVRYEHLTQNENAEMRRHPQFIGQFGMGLRNALPGRWPVLADPVHASCAGASRPRPVRAAR